MASHPPGACCYAGVKHEGTAKGEMKSIDSYETYFSYPDNKSTEYGILLITDVIGHRFINAQLIADQLAANGYFVVMPDLFYGDPVPLNRPGDFDIMAWLKGDGKEKKGHLLNTVEPVINACLAEMRGKYGCKKIGGVGYCFGGKYVVRYLQPGKLDAGYTAHPSFVEPDELAAIKRPLAISAAESDSIFPTEKRHQTEETLKKTGQQYQINLYSGVEHGFATRCDLSNPVQKYAKESAFLQMCQWFDNHLK